MYKIKFDIPKPKLEYPIPDNIKSLFRFRQIKKPSEWAKDNFKLAGRGYSGTGSVYFEGREWQIDIVDAITKYKDITICGPVQTGKSLCGIDIPWAWWNANIGGRSLIVYADKETVVDVFDEKIKDIIKVNLKDLWSGNDDNLKKEKLLLLNGIARCGSANVENDIATFPADLICLDELAKYRNNFDIIRLAKGRQSDYQDLPGAHAILLKVSSPKKYGDQLYIEMHKEGVLVLKCKVPCPHCGKYQEMVDDNIKEIPNKDGTKDHSSYRIKQEKAAYYECPHCKGIIEDKHRWNMLKNYKWATDNEIVRDRIILNPDPLREKTDSVCFWYNRLLSIPTKWTFADCLAAFFSAMQSLNPKAWEAYQNEDMARFLKPNTSRTDYAYLNDKKLEYYQFGESARIPNEVIILLVGIDTQDTGFYYTVVGFGQNMESWRIRSDFIKCDMKESKYKDPKNVLECLKNGLLSPSYIYQDNRTTGIIFGFIDEGGHRRDDVHYICKHLSFLKPYKGASSPNAEPLRKSANDIHYMGNTRYWSELVARDMESDTWHLPMDISKEYLRQVTKQYWQEEKDRNGNIKYVFISGKDDHARDCENYALAAAYHLHLPEKLNNEVRINQIKVAISNKLKENEQNKVDEKEKQDKKVISNNPFANRGRRIKF